MKRIFAALLALTVLALLVGTGQPVAHHASAASPGTTLKRLLNCPDTDGSGVVLTPDITKVVRQYGIDLPSLSYRFIDDLTADGVIRTTDFSIVVQHYGQACPLVDTQVARATLWAIDNGVPIAEDATALAALHYYRGSTDVPGQGVHYIKIENWDGTFDPMAPEGLVYQNGRLAAQLYVVDGDVVGWGTHAATSFPPPTTPHGIDLEGAADGPQCNPACSWDGSYDGWHMHYYLCTIHIGTVNAMAIPAELVYPAIHLETHTGCANYAGEPECTVPITVVPCYRWGQNVGWMGHLWNWLGNKNQIPDNGGTNGRFADCFPDDGGWKAFNCPA